MFILKRPNFNNVRIFISDLTYNTNRVATEALPINIGFMASYCRKRFGSKVDIKLFKYHEDLEKAIEESPPDILGLSNYIWNHNLGREIFKIFTEKNPNGLRIFGGPNFPIDIPSQKSFFKDFPYFDIYIPDDGEIGFSNVIEKALECNIDEIRTNVLQSPIEGCIIKNNGGVLLYSFANTRIKKLDDIPSPYLSGMLDQFFDENLIPMIQTNRGCPFTCTFCTDGRDSVNQVNRFSKERIKEEIEYIAKHVKKNVHALLISDLNFGMLPGDLETSNEIAKIKEEYNYPHRILATTGKNQKEKIIQSIKTLGGGMSLSMSVQSLDQNVLTNIRRGNISTDHMLALMPTIKEYGLDTVAEVIVGLPGETYESNLNTIRELIQTKIDDVIQYTCLLLPGSEMGTPEQRDKWKFKSKFQILPEDFATLRNGKRVCEYGEYAIGSKDLSFDEYVDLRTVAFTLWMTNKGILYNPLIKLLRYQKIDVAELFFEMVKRRESSPKLVKDVYDSFRESTINESYDSPEEILSKIQDDEFYQKLLNEEVAINVIRYHQAVVLAKCMDEWTEYVITIVQDLLKENKKWNEEIKSQFEDLANYCRGSCHNPLGKERMKTNLEFTFKYDIKEWLKDSSDEKSLNEYIFENTRKGIFRLTEEKYQVVEDSINLFGTTFGGYYKGLKLLPQYMLYREIFYESDSGFVPKKEREKLETDLIEESGYFYSK